MDLRRAYVRGKDGDCKDLPINEAVAHFLDDENGYRLTIYVDAGEIVIRKNGRSTGELEELDGLLDDHKSFECDVTFHGEMVRTNEKSRN